jgi:type II secretory pathway component PulM
MIKYFARASSLERRFLIGAALVVFLLFNYLFVWPRFSEWAKTQTRDVKAHDTLKTFEAKIAKKPAIEKDIAALERAGGNVPLEDQASDFIRTIQNQAAASSITILSSTRMPERTNQFFVERAQALSFQTTDQPLVDFLYNLSAGNSLVRVRGLSLRPDQPHQNLVVNATLVGSYQKKVTRPAVTAPAVAQPSPPATNKPPAKATDKPPAKGPDTKSPVPPTSGVPKTPTPPKK